MFLLTPGINGFGRNCLHNFTRTRMSFHLIPPQPLLLLLMLLLLELLILLALRRISLDVLLLNLRPTWIKVSIRLSAASAAVANARGIPSSRVHPDVLNDYTNQKYQK